MVLWRIISVPDYGLASWSWFGYGQWSFIHSWSKFWFSVLVFKEHRTSMSFQSLFRAFGDAADSLVGFGILILIWIWSLVFYTTIYQILALNLGFEGAKNIHVHQVSFGVLKDAGGSWLRFGIWIMIWIWLLVIDISMCKDHICPLSPDLGFWRMLEVPEWGLVFHLDLDMVIGS